jgi:hypothetical protein
MANPSLDLLSPGQQPVGRNINMLSSLVRRIAGKINTSSSEEMEGKLKTVTGLRA